MTTKILYVANVRMPTERAHGAQIVKTCEALAKMGTQVELIVPNRTTHIAEDVATYYGLQKTFPIITLPVIDTVAWGTIGFLIESFSFALRALRYVRAHDGIVYGRDEVILGIVSFFTARDIVWESHTGAWNAFARRLVRRAKHVVVISEGLRDFYITQGVSAEHIVVAHDGVDLATFEHVESKEVARQRLKLPEKDTTAMYIGGFGGWKGTETLFEASTFLSKDTQLVVIGGTVNEVAHAKKRYPKVLFMGARSYHELADNQAAADVLVLPTTGKDVIGARFTSPLKLFAYMASGQPIVASDVPSVREVLPKDAAYWFTPDEPESLARAIEKALHDPAAVEKTRIAKSAISLYTWDERAKRILATL